MSESQANKNYSAENIKVLEGLEAVRKGPLCTSVMLVREVYTI